MLLNCTSILFISFSMVALVYILMPVISAAAGLALESCILGGPLLMVPCRRSVRSSGADQRGRYACTRCAPWGRPRCWGWTAPRGRGGTSARSSCCARPLISLQRGVVWEIFIHFPRLANYLKMKSFRKLVWVMLRTLSHSHVRGYEVLESLILSAEASQ